MANNSEEGEYEKYIARINEREKTITEKIANLSDPIEAIESIVKNEGVNLKTVWETDSGYPFDAVVFCIAIMMPLLLGLLGSAVASFWKPRMIGEELYDEYGKRIVEFPKMPIAYLQQSTKDVSAVRENRNSLAWLCHRWLISTNDVVKELQSPYPLEGNRNDEWAPLTFFQRILGYFVEKASKPNEHSRQKLKMQKQKRKRMKKSAFNLFNEGTRKTLASQEDISYLKERALKARHLCEKLAKWTGDYTDDRFGHYNESETDSYWSSSETFSSDSGEHWKSYRSNLAKWAQDKKLDGRWAMERRRRRLENETRAKEEPKAQTGGNRQGQKKPKNLNLTFAPRIPEELDDIIARQIGSISSLSKIKQAAVAKKLAGAPIKILQNDRMGSTGSIGKSSRASVAESGRPRDSVLSINLRKARGSASSDKSLKRTDSKTEAIRRVDSKSKIDKGVRKKNSKTSQGKSKGQNSNNKNKQSK